VPPAKKWVKVRVCFTIHTSPFQPEIKKTNITSYYIKRRYWNIW